MYVWRGRGISRHSYLLAPTKPSVLCPLRSIRHGRGPAWLPFRPIPRSIPTHAKNRKNGTRPLFLFCGGSRRSASPLKPAVACFRASHRLASFAAAQDRLRRSIPYASQAVGSLLPPHRNDFDPTLSRVESHCGGSRNRTHVSGFGDRCPTTERCPLGN